MIIVISIISVLLALLYGALERAQKFSRRTITYTELKNIETALKQYHAHYHTWPTNDLANVQIISGDDQGFILDERTSNLLKGFLPPGVSEEQNKSFNPELIPFLELSRYSTVTYAPVNPFKPNNANNPGTTRAYKLLFDTNGDRQITIGADTDAPGTTQPTNIIADIAVWTVIPGTRQTDSSGSPQNVSDVIFGSWQSFGASH